MLSMTIKIGVGLLAVYAVALAVIYAMQSQFIYPAPQEHVAPSAGFAETQLATDDGLVLNAHWQEPESDKPTLVYFHGNAGSLAGSTAATALHAVQGYGVLLVEYRGYGGNAGEPSEDGFYHDGRAAMDFLAERGVDPSRTIIVGNSIGSGPATQMAQEYQSAALILISPFSSLADVAVRAMPVFPVRAMLKDRFDNIAKLPQLSVPVLIQHGTADRVVLFENGERLSAAAPAAEFQVFNGAGHEFAYQTQAQVNQSEWLASIGL